MSFFKRFSTGVSTGMRSMKDELTGKAKAERAAAAAEEQRRIEASDALYRKRIKEEEAEKEREKEAMPEGVYQKGSDTYLVQYIVRNLSAAAAAANSPGFVNDKDQVYENYLTGSTKMEDDNATENIEAYNSNRKRFNYPPIELTNNDPAVKSLIDNYRGSIPSWALRPKYPGGVYRLSSFNGTTDNIWIRYKVTNTTNNKVFEMDENEIGSIVSQAPELTDGVYYTGEPNNLKQAYWVKATETPETYEVDNIMSKTKDIFQSGGPNLRSTFTANNFKRMDDEEANRSIDEYKKRIAAATSSETAGGKGKKRRSTRRSKNSRRCTVKRRKPRLVRQRRR